MVGFNKRKRQVLEHVRDNPYATSSELARALDLEIHNARTLLKKYDWQGLLSGRKQPDSQAKEYTITEKGLERLKWLTGEAAKEKAGTVVTTEEVVNGKGASKPTAREEAAERLRKFAELLKNVPS